MDHTQCTRHSLPSLHRIALHRVFNVDRAVGEPNLSQQFARIHSITNDRHIRQIDSCTLADQARPGTTGTRIQRESYEQKRAVNERKIERFKSIAHLDLPHCHRHDRHAAYDAIIFVAPLLSSLLLSAESPLLLIRHAISFSGGIRHFVIWCTNVDCRRTHSMVTI